MPRDRLIRGALWATVALNALGVAIFGAAALGRPPALLPIEAPPFFAAQIAFTIALFGCVYAWLAMQPVIDPRLVIVGGFGKLGFFTITLIYALSGVVPMSMALNATPDLVLAGIFLWWAR